MDYNADSTLTDSVTACSTALVTLQQLGRSSDADELLTEAESSTNYSTIVADKSRTDAWKLQKYAIAYKTSCPRWHDTSPLPPTSHPADTRSTLKQSSEPAACQEIPAS